MRKKIIITIMSIIIACLAITGIVITKLDRILMAVSPEMYISYRAVNTINEIKKEQEMIKEAIPELKKISESHNAEIQYHSDKSDFDLNEDYNADNATIVFDGVYDKIKIEGYITNDEAGLSIPDLADVYFIFNSSEFGNDVNSSTAKDLIPIQVPEDFKLSIPTKSEEKPIIKESKLIGIGKTLITDAKINHDTGDDYYLVLKSENVKNAAQSFIDLLKESDELKRRFEITGINVNDILDLVNITDAEIGENVVVRYTECKNYVTRLETTIKNGDYDLNISWNCNNKVRLLEDYTVVLAAETDGSKIGLEYSENGNRFFRNEEKIDNRNLKVVFGNEDILNASINLKYDITGRELAGNANINNVTANITGTINKDKTTLDISNIASDKSGISSCKISIAELSNKQISEKKKYPFRDLKAEDVAAFMLKKEIK